ncbi:hypothetical protein J2Z60_002080 [Lactobacillus colini]|uniref:Ribonuclease H1 N-terminal domain-containing protein n=1 Tax=Lactobacillus colini TaxID=1819254 RepID=A0ABS4MGQ4_9LACO|nr:viroplasmin family protein [Lactobacillus colini]MBP2058889.1 hypothetical protein [Lactobacillus colini]
MIQDKKYYAIYTGEGDGLVIHSTWNNIESAVNELMKKNSQAKYYAFNNEDDAKSFAKHGFSEKDKELLLENLRLNRKINTEISQLDDNKAIAFIAGSYTKREDQVGYGALIFTDKGSIMPKELCGIVNNSQVKAIIAGELEAAKQVITWAMTNKKKEIDIYYNNDNLNIKNLLNQFSQSINVHFVQVNGHHITHDNEARHLARSGAQGIEKK